MTDENEQSIPSRGSLSARTGRVEDVNDVKAGDFLWTADFPNPVGFGFRVLWGPVAAKEFAKEREWIRFMMPNVFWDRESMERSIGPENTQDQEHRIMDTERTNDDKAMPPASAGSHGDASAFEAWAARHGLQCRPCGSHYLDSATEWAWLGWQAATLTDDQPQTCPHVVGRTTQHCSLNFTLTDGERMAVAYFAEFGQWPAGKRHAYTLRALLERLG